jgi:SAM-dependent methyltransferase
MIGHEAKLLRAFLIPGALAATLGCGAAPTATVTPTPPAAPAADGPHHAGHAAPPDGHRAPPGHHAAHGSDTPAADPAAEQTPPSPSPPDPSHRAPHGHHRFEHADQWTAVFDSEARDRWQKGDAVIAALAIEPTMAVADVGAGTGYFAVRLARAVPRGVVWAQDVEADMVRHLGERARREGLPQLQAVLAQRGDPSLPGRADLVLLCNVYHHLHDRVAWMRKLAVSLRPGGRVAVVDFTLGDIPVGPPKTMRVSPETISAEMAAAGLVLLRRDDQLLPYQHLLVFSRQP